MNIEVVKNITITVGTTPVAVSEEQDGFTSVRSVITLTNISTAGQVISVSAGDEAVANRGIVLSPGGSYSDSMDSGYKPTQRRITAVSSGAGGSVAVHERVLLIG